MKYGPVPLTRYFSLVPKSESDSDEQDWNSMWSDQKRTGWPDLEKEFRCVILAEAGAGKSFEMEARAKYAQGLGRAAFFIRIEDIEDDFEAAFEVGSAEAFESWLSSKDEAWFFLDSVDEARLESPRAFEKAIRRFAVRIQSAKQRARIFISSRPYAWRACSDRALVEKYLPFMRSKLETTGDRAAVSEEVAVAGLVEPDNDLCVYLLEPLDENGIRSFAEHCGAPQVDRLISELQRANLMSVAARPFDLEAILGKWEDDQTLDGRLQLLQHNIEQSLREIDPDRAQRQPLNLEKAKRGARVLAAAVILTGESGIRVPDPSPRDKGIDAEIVLGDWELTEINALLERGIFNDVLYGVVRFRHREIRELLAAEWFRHQLNNGSSRHATEALFFREQYGCSVITPRLRPILSWLILFDSEIRRKALEIAPEVAVEGGDAAYLPFVERQVILNDIVRRIVEEKDGRSARDNSAIARIAQQDLSDDVLRLITDYQDNEDAIFFLGRVVWQGEMSECVSALSLIAADPTRGLHGRIAATRAVMTCGSREQSDSLWDQLTISAQALPRELLAEVLESVYADAVSVEFLLRSINKLKAYEQYKVTGLRRALHSFIDRLPVGFLGEIVSGLNNYLDLEPYINQQFCQVSKDFTWLLGPAIHAVERLVSTRSMTALSTQALSVMLKVPMSLRWPDGSFDEYKNNLHEEVPAWDDLNDALFWLSVEEARIRLEMERNERLTNVGSVEYVQHYWSFGSARFHDVLRFIATRDLQDDKLVALSLAHRLFMQADQPDDWLIELKGVVQDNLDLKECLNAFLNPVKPQVIQDMDDERVRRREEQEKEKEVRTQKRSEWIKGLKAAPDIVRYPPGSNLGDFSESQFCLLREIEGEGLQTSRGGGANWEGLIPEFGEDVARAYRDAALVHWRHFMPGLRSDGSYTPSIPYSLIFAMAGLDIEAREVDNFPENLTKAEVQHALRYFVWELNGFPNWLEQLHRAYPKLAQEAILTELYWELARPETDQPVHYVLHDLVYHAPWLHGYLAPSIIAWMEENDTLNISVLQYCIRILLSGGVGNEALSRLAQSKITAGEAKLQMAFWYALWVDVDAEDAILAVDNWLSSLPEEAASHEAQLFITGLMGTRLPSNTGMGRGDFRSAKHLKTLYVLMHRYIRGEDDINRAGGGVYSPGLRDNAQDGRDTLLNQLSEIPGKETYFALAELAKDHPDAKYHPWMRNLAYRRAEKDADLGLWSTQEVRDHDQYQIRTPMTHRQLFDLTVDRLIDLKDWVEQGNDSPYDTWQKAEGETAVRNLIAGWLNGQARGRYTCAQENELSNKQRPDIFMQSPQVESAVPIELKILDKKWSGPELCERLRNQLVGDYLREETAGCGVFLLIWQGRSTKSYWEINGKRVTLTDLVEALKSYWLSIANSYPKVEAIDVILIDFTTRDAKSEG